MEVDSSGVAVITLSFPPLNALHPNCEYVVIIPDLTHISKTLCFRVAVLVWCFTHQHAFLASPPYGLY